MTPPIARLTAKRLAQAALALAAQAASFASLAAAGSPALPAALAEAQELAPLPGGAWLALEKRALRLIDASGVERGRIAVRGEHLDQRPGAQGALAVVLDADTQRTLAVRVDLARMQISASPAVESPPYSVEAMCMYRDPQGHDHVFLIGDEGLAEQWLLRAEGALLVRRLALPPQARGCRVDDTTQRLFVNEEGAGVWAYNAEAEGLPTREAVALSKPLGPLTGSAAAITLLPGGLATVDERGELRAWRRTAKGWQATTPGPRLANGGVGALAASTSAGRVQIHWHGGKRDTWSSRSLAWAAAPVPERLPVVLPTVQTEPVARFGDAADDPAIWVHPTDPARSLVLGTNKKQGLLVYDLEGRQRQLLEVGRINNVDLRQRVRLGASAVDVAVATQRDDLSVVLFLVDANGAVREHSRIPTGLKDIYGLCLYQPTGGGLDVFVNDKDGSFLRYRLESPGLAADGTPRIESRIVQRFKLATQPEACVADDAAGRLFIGEEKRGVWVMPLADTATAPPLRLIVPVGPLLHADVEGLALHHGTAGSYLVVSSQGNNSYVVVDAAPPFRPRGAFRIGLNAARAIDGVSETDGLEVTSAPLGPAFPRGALVVQDGFKRLPDGPQNFKIVAWDEIARALGLP